MRATGKAKTVIWRWQERFREEGAAGLWRDKTRPSRIPPLGPEVAERGGGVTVAGAPGAGRGWGGQTGGARARGEPLDRLGHGQSGGDQRQFGAADMARSRPEAAS